MREEIPETLICLNSKNANRDTVTMDTLASGGVDLISNRDVPTPDRMIEPWGLCAVTDGGYRAIASPYWHWGKVYEKLVRAVLDGKLDAMSAGSDRAVSYWWGMRSGSVGVLIDDALLPGELTVHLGEHRVCHIRP